MPDAGAVVLGFDTSAAHCAAAVVQGDRVLAERVEPMARGQAERLFPFLEDLLAEAGVDWRDLAAIGVGTGPGNFTGIRISVAAARGLGLSLSIPAIGITATEAAACDLPRPCRVIVPLRGDEAVWQDFFAAEGCGQVGEGGDGAPASPDPAGGRQGGQAAFPPLAAQMTDEDRRARHADPLTAHAPSGGHAEAAALAEESSVRAAYRPDLAAAEGRDAALPDSSTDHSQTRMAAPFDHRPRAMRPDSGGRAAPPESVSVNPAGAAQIVADAVAFGAAVRTKPAPAAIPVTVQATQTYATQNNATQHGTCDAAPETAPAMSASAALGTAAPSPQAGPRIAATADLPPGPPHLAPRWPVAVATARLAARRLPLASSLPRPAPVYLRPADAAPPRDPPPTLLP